MFIQRGSEEFQVPKTRSRTPSDVDLASILGDVTIDTSDPAALREMSQHLLKRASAIEKEREERALEEKVNAFAKEHRQALGCLLNDCYICTEPLLRGLGKGGDFSVGSWACNCTTWRVAHCHCLRTKFASGGRKCDYCKSTMHTIIGRDDPDLFLALDSDESSDRG